MDRRLRFAPPLEDPAKSKVVGKVGYGVMPPGPKQQVSGTFGDGIGVSAMGANKGPAWYYVLWATNKTMQARMLAERFGCAGAAIGVRGQDGCPCEPRCRPSG